MRCRQPATDPHDATCRHAACPYNPFHRTTPQPEGHKPSCFTKLI